MNRRLPDLESVTGVLESVAPPIDERAEREAIKNAAQDYDLDYGPKPDGVVNGPDGRLAATIRGDRQQHVQAMVHQNRMTTTDVPVSYGPAGREVRDRVKVSRTGDGIWVEGSTEGIKALVMSRNPQLQFGIMPEPTDTMINVLSPQQAAELERHAYSRISRGA